MRKTEIDENRMSKLRQKEQEQSFPAFYYKAKMRVVEEIAIQRIVDEIREESGTEPIPEVWVTESDSIYNSLRQMIKHQVEIERTV